MTRAPVEISWSGALADDDYEFLGHHDPELLSSWEHCRTVVLAAERHGFDGVLLPPGYASGIDAITFAAAVAPLTRRIRLLLGVRAGDLTPPQLARQLASLDEIAEGRMAVNVLAGGALDGSLSSAARYQRTLEVMYAVHELLAGRPLDLHGEFVDLHVDPPRVATTNARLPITWFGGYSDAARQCAAAAADVYLMGPDTVDGVRSLVDDLDRRAATFGRALGYAWRSHVIVRATEDEARAAARRLVSRLGEGAPTRTRHSEAGAARSAGVAHQLELRARADADGYLDRHLFTGIARAGSGVGAAIVGDPDQVLGVLRRLQDAGVDAFVLSGHPHVAECDRFARYVLTAVEHAPLDLVPQPVVLS